MSKKPKKQYYYQGENTPVVKPSELNTQEREALLARCHSQHGEWFDLTDDAVVVYYGTTQQYLQYQRQNYMPEYEMIWANFRVIKRVPVQHELRRKG